MWSLTRLRSLTEKTRLYFKFNKRKLDLAFLFMLATGLAACAHGPRLSRDYFVIEFREVAIFIDDAESFEASVSVKSGDLEFFKDPNLPKNYYVAKGTGSFVSRGLLCSYSPGEIMCDALEWIFQKAAL